MTGRRTAPLRATLRAERGSALLEFNTIGLVLLIPLIYIMITVLDVQRTSYALTQAAREAGRVFALEGDQAAAEFAAAVALHDQGLERSDAQILWSCESQPCLTPGGEVKVTLRSVVRLPLLPDVFARPANAEIRVSAEHVVVLDNYRSLQ